MTALEFTESIVNGWPRNAKPESASIMEDIERLVADAPAAALKAILKDMKTNYPPNQLIGEYHIYEAARKTGSALKKQSEVRRHQMTCDVCYNEWVFIQGSENNVVCPVCKMDGMAQWMYHHEKKYRKNQNKAINGGVVAWYHTMMRHCEKILERESRGEEQQDAREDDLLEVAGSNPAPAISSFKEFAHAAERITKEKKV